MKALFEQIKPVLALLVIILGFSYFYMCSIRGLKPDPQILIAIVSAVGQTLSYYFGSSSKNTPDATVNNADTVNVKN